MRYPKNIRPVSVLFLLILLISCGTVVALSGTSATDSAGGSPFRLRLRAAKNTLRSGEATSVWVEFLDRDYQKVQSDGSRSVVFGIATRRRNAGVLTAREPVVVKRGDWSAATMFTAGEAGSVVVTCQSEGLDSDETTLVVTPPASSWLSQIIGMFETTAYADKPTEFRFDSREKRTSAREDGRLDFQLIWAPPPESDTTVQVSTDPPSRIDYQGKSWYDGVADIKLGPQNGASSDISIISSQEGKITVTAKAESHFTQASAIANFTKPVAERIRFKDDPKEIPPGENMIAVTLEVTDKAGFPVKSGEVRTFSFEKGSDIVPVEFKPPSFTLLADKSAVEILVHLKDLKELPPSGEIRVGATSPGLKSDWKRIAVRGEVKSVKLQGNRTVQLGKAGAYFDVQLLDKNDKLVSTDKDRTINLTATHGTINPVTISKGQSVARVHYVASGSAGQAVIHVNSEGIAGEAVPIQLVVALYWLVIVALVGGLVGGVIRHISKNGYRLPRILPCWTGDCWDLGLVGKLAVSIVGGLILYLLVKFGLYQVMASLTRPEALDSGTKLVAFFFGVIGGFAGIYLFDWVVSKLLPGAQQQPTPAA